MGRTPFPARPCDVVVLTAPEFACALNLDAAASLAVGCRRFVDDANRGLVWLIRFRALVAWCERPDVAPWLTSGALRARHACEVAASFRLNDDWQFDAEPFRSAVESAGRDG